MRDLVNDAALIMGYFVMALWVIFALTFLAFMIERAVYEIRRARKHDRDWDNVRSRWVFEDRPRDRNTDRHDTDVLDPIVPRTVEYQAVYNQEEDSRNERSRFRKAG